MKTLLVIAMLLVASVASAETWKEQEIREAQERMMQLKIEQQKQINIGRAQQGKLPTKQCIKNCVDDYSACLSMNSGVNEGCTSAQYFCASRCYK